MPDYWLKRLLQLNAKDVFQISGDYVKHFTQVLEYFVAIKTVGATNKLDDSFTADTYTINQGSAVVSLQYSVST